MSDEKRDESYRDILVDCLQSLPKDGDIEHSHEESFENTSEEPLSHSKRLILFSGLAVVLLLANVAVLAFYSSSGRPSLTKKEADMQLQVTYGDDYNEIAAISSFLAEQEDNLTTQTRSFRESVHTLNESFQSEDDLEEQGEFSQENFLYVGKTLIYRE